MYTQFLKPLLKKEYSIALLFNQTYLINAVCIAHKELGKPASLPVWNTEFLWNCKLQA